MLYISMILVLAVLGLITWLVITFIPMPEVGRKLIQVLFAIVAIFYVLHALGIVGGSVGDIRIPTIR